MKKLNTVSKKKSKKRNPSEIKEKFHGVKEKKMLKSMINPCLSRFFGNLSGKKHRIFTLVMLIMLWSVGSLFAATIYVDADADTGGGGSSWADAYDKLQDALNDASLSPGDQIWVAEGTYYPDEGSGQTGGDRLSTFDVPSGVEVYGGFDGTESSLSERDISANETILSGDLDQDDNSGGDNSENAYNVVKCYRVSDTTILDGFTVTAGNANDSTWPNNNCGGGIYNNSDYSGSSNPQVSNCTISGNYAWYGGGMYNNGNGYYGIGTSSPTLTNCTISGNSVYLYGGGMSNDGGSDGISSPTLTNCTISGNISTDGNGGGMYNDGCFSGTCNPTLTNCTISGNSSEAVGFIAGGGGMFNDGCNGTCSPTLINCTISGNSASDDGGGMYNEGDYYGNSSPTLTNCTLSGNSASDKGGGMYNDGCDDGNASPTLTNCILWNDNASEGNEVYNYEATPSYSYCDVAGGVDGTGNINDDPLFVTVVPAAPSSGGDLRIMGISPCADVGDNSANSETYDIRGTGYERKLNKETGNPGTIDMGAYEYKLNVDPLPVTLSTFTAQYLNNVPILYWRTMSETDNIGWYVYRNKEEDFEQATRITNDLIEGYGTTTEPHDYFYYDEELEAISGDRYRYWIENIDFGGAFHRYGPKVLTIPDIPDDHSSLVIPKQYGLHQNKPNPLSMGKETTKISFLLPKTARAELKIYNIRGELIKDLYNDIAYGDDEVKLTWDGRDENGVEQAIGIYLYQLELNGKVYETKRLILLR